MFSRRRSVCPWPVTIADDARGGRRRAACRPGSPAARISATIADLLRIQPLFSGRWSRRSRASPGGPMCTGFLRSYADSSGLDGRPGRRPARRVADPRPAPRALSSSDAIEEPASAPLSRLRSSSWPAVYGAGTSITAAIRRSASMWPLCHRRSGRRGQSVAGEDIHPPADALAAVQAPRRRAGTDRRRWSLATARRSQLASRRRRRRRSSGRGRSAGRMSPARSAAAEARSRRTAGAMLAALESQARRGGTGYAYRQRPDRARRLGRRAGSSCAAPSRDFARTRTLRAG